MDASFEYNDSIESQYKDQAGETVKLNNDHSNQSPF